MRWVARQWMMVGWWTLERFLVVPIISYTNDTTTCLHTYCTVPIIHFAPMHRPSVQVAGALMRVCGSQNRGGRTTRWGAPISRGHENIRIVGVWPQAPQNSTPCWSKNHFHSPLPSLAKSLLNLTSFWAWTERNYFRACQTDLPYFST